MEAAPPSDSLLYRYRQCQCWVDVHDRSLPLACTAFQLIDARNLRGTMFFSNVSRQGCAQSQDVLAMDQIPRWWLWCVGDDHDVLEPPYLIQQSEKSAVNIRPA